MTAQEIFAKLSNHQDDYEFTYKGKTGAVCIFDTEIIAGYAGSELTFRSLVEMMNAPFLDGKSLNEVAEKIDLYG